MSAPSPAEAMLARVLAGGAALPLRSAAARGALPLPRASLVRLYLHLRSDPEEAVRNDARASLEALGPDQVAEVLADPACAPEVLAHFASTAVKDDALAELIAFHPGADERSFSILAAAGNAAVIDLILTNQQRLLSTPGLLDRLSTNPALRADQRGRILELLERFVQRQAEETAGTSRSEAASGELSDEDFEATARLLDVDVGELFAASEIIGGEEFENAEDPNLRSVYRKILTLSTAQKAMLAMKGGREERMILVRDTNKVVALSVLKNGRLTEQDVETFAAMRNLSDEVLRVIGSSREWTKSYTIAAALVRNPRTPPGVSTNFIPRLVNRDLKILAADKNVPEIIRRMSRKTLETRLQQLKPTFKKKG